MSFDYLRDDYIYIESDRYCKNVSFSRRYLDTLANEMEVDSKSYKNKRLLLNAILYKWEKKFKEYINLKKQYDDLYLNNNTPIT